MINFNFPIIQGKFKQHENLKEQILDAINNQDNDTLEKTEDFYCSTCMHRVSPEIGFNCANKNCLCECYTYNITRVDWNRATDLERPWVKIFISDFLNYLDQEMLKLSLENPKLVHLWFQQYNHNGSHGWHTHGHSFTGVYYLELDKQSPRTQIAEPITFKMTEVDAKEGDIIIFPSMYMHRSPLMKTTKRKTIISFNFDCINIDADTQTKLKELYGF